jgi:N-acylneuraminate cytidylyltransferase
MDEVGKVNFSYPCFARSQDLMPSFHDVQFYWMNTKKCMVLQEILTDNTGSVEISELEGQDIDNEVDWKLAELKYEPYKALNKQSYSNGNYSIVPIRMEDKLIL